MTRFAGVVGVVRSGLGRPPALCIDGLRALAGVMVGSVEAAIGLFDLDAVLAQIDVDAIVRRVDVQQLIDRVDIDAIVRRVDVDALVGRVDMGALVDRIDVNALIGRMDVDALVEQTDLGAVIAQSTGGIASGAVDLVRRQGVGLDGVVSGWAAHVRRRRSVAPAGPPLLTNGQGA